MIFACSKGKSGPEALEGVSASLVASGCPEAIFPHPEGWSEVSQHGTCSLQGGRTACLECHQERGESTSPEAPPSCTTCHALYPHADNWGEPAVHGDWVTDRGTDTCATSCHGSDFGGGLSQVSCSQCHAIFPHSEDWVDPNQHGRTAIESTNQLCTGSCHGSDLRGGSSDVSCFSCHADYPHPTDWVDEGHRGADRTSCSSCHGDDGTGGISGKSCSECHTYPHPDNWSSVDQHGIFALSRDVRSRECAPCHGVRLDGGERSELNCSRCHAAFPHEADWRGDIGAPGQHTSYVVNNGVTSCATSRCHGVDLVPTPGTTLGANCTECHRRNPHPAGWRSGNLHGTDTVRSESNDFDRCLTCHDSGRAGAAAARHCFQCHDKGPHQVLPPTERNVWSRNGHGTAALNLEARRRCGDCHGDDLRGSGRAVSCFSCHENFPHAETSEWTQVRAATERFCRPCEELDEGECDSEGNVCWDAAVTHVSPHAQQFFDRATLNEASRCETCHGNDLQGGNALRSCGDGSCHAVLPQHMTDPDWRTDDGGSHGAAYLAGAQGFASPCSQCHRQLGRGLDGRAPDCQPCHGGVYPHLHSPDVVSEDDWQLATKHGYAFIGREWSDPPTRNVCKNCHGDDYRGRGVAEKDCAGCHDHYDIVSHQGCCTVAGRPGAPWRQVNKHYKVRNLAVADGDTDRCLGCHEGQNRLPAQRSTRCTVCHATAP